MEVLNKFSAETPVYLAGHSLGGSMAAIMLGRWWDEHDKEVASSNLRSESWLIQKPVACYTYGMPRYANQAVISDFALPWHIFTEGDSIPTVPPISTGYADLPLEREYCLSPDSGHLSKSLPSQKQSNLPRLNYILNFFKGIPNHMMERYLWGLHACFAKNHAKVVSSVTVGPEFIEIDEIKLKINHPDQRSEPGNP
jgi:hypothetical protein